jgi:hypothetical protein
MHNVLVSGTKVKLYGLDVTDYNEDVAKKSVSGLVNMVRSCFPDDGIPIDLEELLEDLVKDALNVIQTSLLNAGLGDGGTPMPVFDASKIPNTNSPY